MEVQRVCCPHQRTLEGSTMKKHTIYTMTACALMAALMCVLCPVSVPIGPIPISLSILVLIVTTLVLGTWRALVSYTVYLLLGAVGMPVFSGFQGGLAKLAGPTGGYLVGFFLFIAGGGVVMELTGSLSSSRYQYLRE